MQPLRANPFLWAPRPRTEGLNFAVSSEVADAVEVCLFDADGIRDAGRVARNGPPTSGTACCPDVGAGPTVRAAGPRARGPPRRLALQPGQAPASTRTPRRSTARSHWGESVFGHRIDAPDERQRRRLGAGHAQVRGHRTVTSTGAAIGAPRVPLEETVIYETHVKGLTYVIPTSLRSSAAPMPAWPTRPSPAISPTWASPRSSCFRSTSSCTTAHLLDRGLRNYWGYNSIGFLAPHGEYSSAGDGGGQVARVQGHGQGAPRRWARGDPRRGLQPHRRGQPPWAHPVAQRHRQPGLLPARR